MVEETSLSKIRDLKIGQHYRKKTTGNDYYTEDYYKISEKEVARIIKRYEIDINSTVSTESEKCDLYKQPMRLYDSPDSNTSETNYYICLPCHLTLCTCVTTF